MILVIVIWTLMVDLNNVLNICFVDLNNVSIFIFLFLGSG